jgi:hypothetical protein
MLSNSHKLQLVNRIGELLEVAIKASNKAEYYRSLKCKWDLLTTTKRLGLFYSGDYYTAEQQRYQAIYYRVMVAYNERVEQLLLSHYSSPIVIPAKQLTIHQY